MAERVYKMEVLALEMLVNKKYKDVVLAGQPDSVMLRNGGSCFLFFNINSIETKFHIPLLFAG